MKIFKKTSKKDFFIRNMNIKSIISGLLFAIMSFTMVYAFMIQTNVDYAIQYIQQTFYTDSGGNGGTVKIHIGSGINNDNIWLNGQVESEQYCDKNGLNCRKSVDIITGSSMIQYNIPVVFSGGGRRLTGSDIFNEAGIVMIGESDPASVPIPSIKFYINGDSLYNGNLLSLGALTGINGVYTNNFVYSSGGYCDYVGNCHKITDFYTTGQSDARYYTTGYITGHYYDKTYIDNSFYTTGQSDARYITGEIDPVWSAVSGNYFTGGYISGNFQDDIDATVCSYGIAGIADDGTISCATNINFYANGLSFNSTNGVLTIQMSGTSDITGSLDGRYLTGYTETDPIWNSVSGNYYNTTYIDNTYYTTGQSDARYYTKTETDNRYVQTGYINNVTDGNIPYQNGGVLNNSPLNVNGNHVETTNAIVIGNTTDTPSLGMIKFSGDHFYGYNLTGWQQLD